MPPWEKYANTPPAGPWSKYQQAAPTAAPMAAEPPRVPAHQNPSFEGLPVPDGQGGIDERYNAPAAPAPPPDTAQLFDSSARGAVRGLLDIPGGMVDLANLGLGGAFDLTDIVVPGDQSWLQTAEKPFGGSESLYDAAEVLIPGDPTPVEEMSPQERIGHEANRFAAGALGGNAAIRKGIDLFGDVLRDAPFVGPMVRTQERAPTAHMIDDTIAGAGAGVTYGGYETFVPEDIQQTLGPVGEVLSMIGGAIGANTISGLTQKAASAPIIRDAVGGAGDAIDAVGRATGVEPISDVGQGMSRFSRTGGNDPNLRNPDGTRVKRKDADLAANYAQMMSENPQNAARQMSERTNELGEFAGPGSMPTAGLASRDPGLVGFELAARNDPNLQSQFVVRDQAVERAALDQADNIAPANASGRQFTDAVETRHAQDVDLAERRVDWSEEHLAGVNDRRAAQGLELAAERGRATQASQNLDEAVVPTMTEAQRRKNDTFRDIDPAGDTRVPLDRLQSTVDEIDAESGGLANPSAKPTGWMDRIRKETGADLSREEALSRAPEDLPSGAATFKDLNTTRIQIAEDIKKARREGNFTLADNLQRLKSAIDAETEHLAESGSPAGKRAQAALEEYARFRKVWNAGPGDAATKFRQDFNQDRVNRSTTPPSQTAGRFLGPKRPEDAASLRRVIQSDKNPEAAQRAAGDFMVASLADAPGVVRADGTINPDAVRRWGQMWGEDTLSLSPMFKRQFDAILVNAQRGSEDAKILIKQIKDAKSQLLEAKQDTEAARRVLGKDPVNAVSSILSSGDPERTIRELMERIDGNESARNGIKAAIREYLLDKATTSGITRTGSEEVNPLSFARLDGLFKQHEQVLASVFTSEEMNALRASHKFLKTLEQRNMKVISGSQTSPQQARWEDIKKPFELALKFKYGMLRGGGLYRTLGQAMSLLPGDDAARELISRMWFDPDLARHLLTRDVEKIGTPAYNRRLILLLSASNAGENDVGSDVAN